MENGFLSLLISGYRSARALGAVCVATLLAASTASADQISTAVNFGPFAIGSGGEFTVTPDAPLANLNSAYSPLAANYVNRGSFQTFCVERNEIILPGTTYDVTFNNVTMFTGKPLTVGVAYLYQQFATGALLYNYTDTPPGTRAGYAPSIYNAFNLQTALWYYMGEYSYDAYNPYMNGSVFVPANAMAADNGAYGVTIMNLWAPGQPHDPAHAYQDLLVYAPVPEPSIFALSGFGIAALFVFRRRK